MTFASPPSGGTFGVESALCFSQVGAAAEFRQAVVRRTLFSLLLLLRVQGALWSPVLLVGGMRSSSS